MSKLRNQLALASVAGPLTLSRTALRGDIELDADSATGAARQALEIHRDRESARTIFEVESENEVRVLDAALL